MRGTSQNAAQVLRNSLIRDGPTPATFRAALARIPSTDRDAWLDVLWDIDELPEDDPLLPRGCV
ncbi:MAG: hypothetical protein JKY37_16675, partial [Nannocystaceae bacterium]|nr:hypothetical protein [Nannocystaceae bacterium]